MSKQKVLNAAGHVGEMAVVIGLVSTGIASGPPAALVCGALAGLTIGWVNERKERAVGVFSRPLTVNWGDIWHYAAGGAVAGGLLATVIG